MQRGSASGPCQMSIDTPTKRSNAQHLVEYETKKIVMQQPMDSYVCGIKGIIHTFFSNAFIIVFAVWQE